MPIALPASLPLENADRVERHVRLFQKLPKFVERVPGIVVLPVADKEQGSFRMCSALHLFHPEIAGVVESGLALGLDKSEFIQNRITVACFIKQ